MKETYNESKWAPFVLKFHNSPIQWGPKSKSAGGGGGDVKGIETKFSVGSSNGNGPY